MASIQKVILAVVLASCSCDKEVLCKTTCGMEFMGSNGGTVSDGWTCEAIQEQEDRTLAAFSDAGILPTTCQNLNGYRMWINKDGPSYMSSYDDVEIAGETMCWEGWIQIAKTPQPRYSAFSHELAHVAQSCDPLDHTGWVDGGIFRAIEAADE